MCYKNQQKQRVVVFMHVSCYQEVVLVHFRDAHFSESTVVFIRKQLKCCFSHADAQGFLAVKYDVCL